MDTHYQVSEVYGTDCGVHRRFMGNSSLFYTDASAESLILKLLLLQGLLKQAY